MYRNLRVFVHAIGTGNAPDVWNHVSITVENVEKSFDGHRALRGVSLTIEDGEFAAILGPTGAGKTSLLRLIAGIDRPDRGRILYDGRDMAGVPVQQRSIAMVYQQFVNYPTLTVYDNIASPLRVAKPRRSKSEIDRRVNEAADLLGIREVLQHRPAEVSGGQQQRAAIARALVKDAKYIFLDEPLANLDFKLREELRGELKRLFRKQGGAVVYATPEPVDALSMATHTGVMLGGELLQYGRAREVYDAPASVAVGQYFSYPTMNVVPGALETANGQPYLRLSDDLRIDLSGVEAALHKDAYDLGIRAHALDVTRRSDTDISFSATVVLSEVVGSDTEIHVMHNGQPFTVLTERVLTFEEGDAIECFLDVRNLYLFDPDTRRRLGTTSSDRFTAA